MATSLKNVMDRVKNGLGNRSSGRIGGSSVDSVVVAGINKGFRSIIRLANPDYYNRFANLPLNPTNYAYIAPTSDIDGSTINIKQIMACSLVRTGDTSTISARQITQEEFLKYDLQNSSDTGTPDTFCYNGGRLYFTKYPDDHYTLRMAVNAIPAEYSTSSTSVTLPIEEVWIDVVEAYAKAYCFKQLQQMKSAAYWEETGNNLKREAKAVFNKQPAMKHPNRDIGYSGNPELNPFVKRFN